MNKSDSNDTDYRPISCDSHDTFEIAVLHRTRVRLAWTEDGNLHTETLTPVDIETTNREEYLIARSDNGQTVRVRLDRVRSMQPL